MCVLCAISPLQKLSLYFNQKEKLGKECLPPSLDSRVALISLNVHLSNIKTADTFFFPNFSRRYIYLERAICVSLSLSCQDGLSLLHYSALNGHTNICALLLDRGADLNPRDNVSVRGGRSWLWEGVVVFSSF